MPTWRAIVRAKRRARWRMAASAQESQLFRVQDGGCAGDAGCVIYSSFAAGKGVWRLGVVESGAADPDTPTCWTRNVHGNELYTYAVCFFASVVCSLQQALGASGTEFAALLASSWPTVSAHAEPDEEDEANLLQEHTPKRRHSNRGNEGGECVVIVRICIGCASDSAAGSATAPGERALAEMLAGRGAAMRGTARYRGEHASLYRADLSSPAFIQDPKTHRRALMRSRRTSCGLRRHSKRSNARSSESGQSTARCVFSPSSHSPTVAFCKSATACKVLEHIDCEPGAYQATAGPRRVRGRYMTSSRACQETNRAPF